MSDDPAISDYAETFLLPSTSAAGSKEELDVAFAAELLKSGTLSERQLSSLLSTWSIHGDVSLQQHVANSGLLSAAQLQQLAQSAAQSLDAISNESANEQGPMRQGSSHLSVALERVDASGRLAKLLGVSSSAAVGGMEDRTAEGRYELLRKLGQGGLGTVWLARDLQLQRLVALKETTNVADASEASIQRFRHEAEITGRLEHPGIVPVYQLGEDGATGRSFYTMRFLGKSTLHDSIAEYHERREEGDEDPMLLRNLLAAFVNVCNAIAHAHSRKVIHRDLKPENVVIDSYGQVILIDWGLAKVLDVATVEQLGHAALSSDGRTAEGQVLGTPLYMAPEQAAGRIDEVDERTDIYGLGAILFAIITGCAPHEKTQAKSVDSQTGARGMISSIASGPTPVTKEVHAEVDESLAAICAKAMARRRYARYQTASELAEDVQRWMAGEPVSAYQEPFWLQARRWIGRHRRLSQALAALLAIVVAAGATLAVVARQGQLAAQQSQFEQMSGDVNEIELQLRSTATNLIRNTRFMATLPPIQGIIRARAGVESDDEDVWSERLATIYTGLLRANPDYLAVSYVAASKSNLNQETAPTSSHDIIRVERNVNDRSYVRRVPFSRLTHVDDDVLLADVIQLEPSDVRLSMVERLPNQQQRSEITRITAAVPVYDDLTGDAFGMVAIETDLTGQLSTVLEGLGTTVSDIYICDGEGNVLVSETTDEGSDGAAASIVTILPGTAPVFSADFISTRKTDGKSYIARRFRVDPTSKGICIVARLPRR